MRALLLLLTPQLLGHVKRRIERLVFTWGEKMLKRPKLKELTDLQANIKARDLLPSSGNCNIWLLNALFSDTFAVRFAQIGDKSSLVQLDAGETHNNSTSWRDVTSEFNTNRTDYNALFF
ncbi:hypothetical protein PR003_g5397 [Phytophthora rubi]|uniref:Uncharacterized protein n=3 Tax=Phytophthora TaxID=4783 RepID=A0A6A4FJL5_9STRA|nr:hypothetical protein PR003_g5397 [Phytophthora rubi]